MNFRRTLTSINKGEVVIPVLRAALYDPAFKSFKVKVGGFEARPPDGWFHPSTHPLWPERQLFWYLAAPERLEEEPFDPHSVMAVTQGKFWHSFIEKVGMDTGLFTGVEVKVEDPVTGARGSMDGTLPEEVFEFKTIRPSKLHKFPTLEPEDPDLAAWYRGYLPGYHAQGQEYMRLSGYRRHRTLLLAMDYPYEMREIVMEYDPFFAREVAEKYKRVRQAAADLRPPLPCCSPFSKDAKACPARLVCPVGQGKAS